LKGESAVPLAPPLSRPPHLRNKGEKQIKPYISDNVLLHLQVVRDSIYTINFS
jgi:hypothetical protein